MKKIILLIILFSFLIIFTTTSIASKDDYNYSVEKVENLPYANADRLVYHVVVKGEPSIGNLKEISKEVVDIAKEKEDRFNAISISLYDEREYIDYGYTLGRSIFAPEGKWEKADTVKSGQYNKMEFTHELKEKEWNKKLSKKELDIWFHYKTLMNDRGLSSDKSLEETAIQFEINEEKVNDILFKKLFWTNSNKKE